MNMNAGAIGNDEDKVRNGFYIGNQSVITEQNFYVEREYDYPAFVKIRFSKIDRSTKSAKCMKLLIGLFLKKVLRRHKNDFKSKIFVQ
ncbi:hypothetical protein HPULCUR_005113 [Helicostylum pulchrum]|uniref:Uncharacterized protein n=1 Tax=Helicostylum pulchrum TaxID=562976 RepID=A0ABP9XY56_9FUNG